MQQHVMNLTRIPIVLKILNLKKLINKHDITNKLILCTRCHSRTDFKCVYSLTCMTPQVRFYIVQSYRKFRTFRDAKRKTFEKKVIRFYSILISSSVGHTLGPPLQAILFSLKILNHKYPSKHYKKDRVDKNGFIFIFYKSKDNKSRLGLTWQDQD